MIPLIFVFKSKINVCSESRKFEFLQFQKYDETLESRKLTHNEIMLMFTMKALIDFTIHPMLIELHI